MTAPMGPADATIDEYRALYIRAQRRFERERTVRLEAEAIAERGLRELYERERQQTLLESLARHANGTSSTSQAQGFALAEICRHMNWACGFVYTPTEAASPRLAVSLVWHPDGENIEGFIQESRAISFECGRGLPGRVWAAKEVAWVSNVTEDDNFPRRDAALECGLSAGIAFPILVRDEVVSVVEFFAREALLPDPTFVNVLKQIGTQLGRVVERERAQRKLVHDATHDSLVGLPNRVLFLDRLERAVAAAQHDKARPYAVLFIDLDRFKLVNDSLGHDAGDAMLVQIAHRFESALRSYGSMHTLARFGGDEFGALLEGVTEAQAVKIAHSLLAELDAPIRLRDDDFHASASIGVTFSSMTYLTAAAAIRDADLSMYSAKSQGGARIASYSPVLHSSAMHRLALEKDLRHAVEEGQFLLYYQPIMALETDTPTGFEALIRWRKPNGDIVAPNAFIDVAEDTGLIVPIGSWVLNEACKTAAIWNALRPPDHPISISVNVSSRQFQQPDFLNEVESALARSGARPHELRIEITESVAINNTDRVTSVLAQLRASGVRISIDDFGTGHSSLSYLQRLPLDVIKIDRSFVTAMSASDEGRAIIRTIVALARTLRMEVVAEGAETLTEVADLKQMGCDYAQGSYFGRPMAESAAQGWLTARESRQHALLACAG